MKYIMLETKEGQKMPFLFPDAMTHLFVAMAMQAIVKSTMKTEAVVVSAGFVGLGLGAEVSGESESLDGLKSNPADAARIMVGESIAFMPDELAVQMLERLRKQAKGK
jgi:hypothetical protein